MGKHTPVSAAFVWICGVTATAIGAMLFLLGRYIILASALTLVGFLCIWRAEMAYRGF